MFNSDGGGTKDHLVIKIRRLCESVYFQVVDTDDPKKKAKPSITTAFISTASKACKQETDKTKGKDDEFSI